MTIDLRTSPEAEVTWAARVLAKVDATMRAAGTDYLVVGATARTLVSIGLLGVPPQRHTTDVDIAAHVDSWDEYRRLAERFAEPQGIHRFIVEGIEVDVVPYGGVEQADRTITWPDDHQMTVLGLQEAVESAEEVQLPGDLSIRIPTVPAQALLKLIAWSDRRMKTTRDAIDLATMIGWYSSGDYLDQMYDENMAVLERFDFDPTLTGAWLLGTHMANLLDGQGAVALLEIVCDPELRGLLARDMAGTVRAPLLVDALSQGIQESAKS
jgi:predicted nucleotidyltransferase